jgi:hypothetical protein
VEEKKVGISTAGRFYIAPAMLRLPMHFVSIEPFLNFYALWLRMHRAHVEHAVSNSDAASDEAC